MSKTKTDYTQQKINLINKFIDREIDINKVLDMLIDARQQRDEYKAKIKSLKKSNYMLTDKITHAKKHFDKAKKFLILN